MATNHIKQIMFRLFPEDANKFKFLSEKWKAKKGTHVLKRCVEESYRQYELHNEVDQLKKKIEELELTINSQISLLQDIYVVVRGISASEKN